MTSVDDGEEKQPEGIQRVGALISRVSSGYRLGSSDSLGSVLCVGRRVSLCREPDVHGKMRNADVALTISPPAASLCLFSLLTEVKIVHLFLSP